MRLTGVNGNYSEKLNEGIKHKLVCIAYKDDQAFFYSRENIQPGKYAHIALTGIGQKELEEALNKMGNPTQSRL